MRTVRFPPARVMVWSRVLGTRAPQVLTRDVARFADRLIVTSEQSYESEGVREAKRAGIPVAYVPGIADMERLDAFAPRAHDGICVGYIGTVNDTKMHPRFADMCAAVDLPDVRFVVLWRGRRGGTASSLCGAWHWRSRRDTRSGRKHPH